MKRIDLRKYGFVRTPEEDFSDDGTRFSVYRLGDVMVSKAVSGGEVFIAGRIESGKLPYAVYSKLPHYRDLDKLSGVLASLVSDQDLADFASACAEYSKEYAAAVAATKYPTLEELQGKCDELTDALNEQVEEAGKLIKDNVIELMEKLGEYQVRRLAICYKELAKLAKTDFDRDRLPYAILNSGESIDFMAKEPREAFYFREIKELIESVVD